MPEKYITAVRRDTAVSPSDPLSELPYFTEWGPPVWKSMVRKAIVDFLGADLRGLRVLEIGARFGKMSCLFGLLGAHVCGVDINREALAKAREEAIRWGVQDRVSFVAYDGSLDLFANDSFDVVFTKSVLVVVPRLDSFLRTLNEKLKPGGRIVFIENTRGGLLHHLRALKHGFRWNYRDAQYFTAREIELVRDIFHIEAVRRSLYPPVCMMLGTKRS